MTEEEDEVRKLRKNKGKWYTPNREKIVKRKEKLKRYRDTKIRHANQTDRCNK